MKAFARTFALLAALASGALMPSPAAGGEVARRTSQTHVVTNVAHLKALTGADYARGCRLNLTDVVTLVDPDRRLFVMQDATGAVALNHPFAAGDFGVGDLISMEAWDCSPWFARFPDFPHRPSDWDIRDPFEAPLNGGDYQLTRMRGHSLPPANGHYSFWIASDNSSELWLSPDEDPAQAKKIAHVARFEWVAPREFTKHPSQRSEPIWLNARQRYYIEAVHEQAVGDANLAVAWEGPTLPRGVIAAAHLSPWRQRRAIPPSHSNGVLREVWTNFFAGNLFGLSGAPL